MKKIKIFNYPWHLAHQYELQKFPWAEWSWLIQYHRQYNATPRGDFFKGNYVPHYEPGKYDLALLHLDQQCLEKELWERGKGSLYRELNSVITDIPKIVIMHGTPYYPEMFENNQDIVDLVKDAVKGNFVIMNSRRAVEMFGFGHAIWHGMDASEWWDLPKEPRVITMIGPAGLDAYYDREFLGAVKDALQEEGIEHCHITVDYTAKDWDDYRKFIGRSLLYFNPTKESPMPRSRTEAMLSGACVLTTPTQDADQFIKNGENGFLITRGDVRGTVDLIKHLFKNYDKAVAIGQAGKKTAQELFSYTSFEAEWRAVVEKVLNTKIEL